MNSKSSSKKGNHRNASRLSWAAAVMLLAGVNLPVHAERADHFKGEPAKTLDQALANLATYQQRLAQALQQVADKPDAMGEIHVLTYTLENALGKLRDDLDVLADTLEAVHVASETGDVKTVQEKGAEFLRVTRKIVK